MNAPQPFYGAQQPQPGAMPPQQPPHPGAHPAYPGQPQPGHSPSGPRQSSGSPAPVLLGIAALVLGGLVIALSIPPLVDQTLLFQRGQLDQVADKAGYATTIIWILEGVVLLVLGIMLLARTRAVKGVAVAGMIVSVLAASARGLFHLFGNGDWQASLDLGYIMETADGIMFYCSMLVAMLAFLPSVLRSLRRKPARPPQQQYYYGMPSGY